MLPITTVAAVVVALVLLPKQCGSYSGKSMEVDRLCVWLAESSGGLRQADVGGQQWNGVSSQCPGSVISSSQDRSTADGMHWVFGVPLYVVDVGEMEEANAILAAVIKEQFEKLDASGWAPDRTYPGAAKPAAELEPADRNDEFVSQGNCSLNGRSCHG